MIKKARIKFILIISSILLVVFGVVFGVFIYTSYDFVNSASNIRINETYKDFVTQQNLKYNFFAIKSTKTKTIYFFDSNIFSEEQLTLLNEKIASKNISNGVIDDINFKIYEDFDGIVIIGEDLQKEYSVLTGKILSTFFIMLGVYGLLFLISFGLSFKVFDPIKQAIIDQKRFISDASHELKTPLTIISASADVLSNEQNNSWVENIKSQTKRMDSLVKDMLTLSKIDEGKVKIDMEKFNLSNEILANVLPFDTLAFENGKILNTSISPNIDFFGDRNGIKKIANILVDNAIKHSKNKSTITISLVKEKEKIIFAVHNFGCDIEEKDKNKIFERFFRGDSSRSRNSGGSGLGLSIAKTIAQKNKWKLLADCKKDDYMKISLILN